MAKVKRDRTICAVPQCNSTATRYPELSFFRFPGSINYNIDSMTDRQRYHMRRRKEWIRILKIGKQVSDRSVVCSKHFKDIDFTSTGLIKRRLKSFAVPSLFLPVSPADGKDLQSKKPQSALEKDHGYSTLSRSSLGKLLDTVNQIMNEDSGNKDHLTERLNFSLADSNISHADKSDFRNAKEAFYPELVSKVESNQEEDIFEEICDKGGETSESDEESEEERCEAVSSTTKRPSAPVTFTPYKINERVEALGRFVACEMKTLCKNPALYLKAQKSILKTLMDAQSELINSEL